MSDQASEGVGSRHYRIASDVRFRVVGGQAVIIVQDAGEAVVLNEVGTRVLELIKAQSEVSTMISELAQQFDADESKIRKDVLDYLADLVEAGVIEEIAQNAATES